MSPSKSLPDTESLDAHIKSRVMAMTQSQNDRDVALFSSLLAPSFQCQSRVRAKPFTKEECLAWFSYDVHPEWHKRVLDVSVQLRHMRGAENMRSADVWLLAEILNDPVGSCTTIVEMKNFVEVEGEWLCIKATVIAAPMLDGV